MSNKLLNRIVLVFIVTFLFYLSNYFSDTLGLINLVSGMILVIFVPGYFVSLCIFKSIDFISRIILSFSLSFIIIPFITFYLSLLNLRITRSLIFYETFTIIVVSLIYLFLSSNKRLRSTK